MLKVQGLILLRKIWIPKNLWISNPPKNSDKFLVQLAGQNYEYFLQGVLIGTNFQTSEEFSEISEFGPNSVDFCWKANFIKRNTYFDASNNNQNYIKNQFPISLQIFGISNANSDTQNLPPCSK